MPGFLLSRSLQLSFLFLQQLRRHLLPAERTKITFDRQWRHSGRRLAILMVRL